MAGPGKPAELIGPMAATTAIGRFSDPDPEGAAAPAVLSEPERHRRLWLQYALQTPQPAKLTPQPENPDAPSRVR